MLTIRRKNRLIGYLFAIAILAAAPVWAQGETNPGLTSDDCIKCHLSAPRDIAANGGAHQSAVTCQDCHQGHPPSETDIIPECSNCHAGEPHFELQGCLDCHNNPHTPMVISLADNLTEPCLTCHTDQMAQLQQHESKHTMLACTTCHREQHGLIPDCTHCHSPHGPEMSQADCLTCHQAHMPKNVTYPDDIPSKSCGSCHSTAYKELAASSAKHNALGCAFCHQNQHKAIPQCQDCHGLPHPEGMMSKFPTCGDCHNTAHDLNR